MLFGGCSAGARGAMFSVDYVQAMLPAGAPPVLAFLDSPLWVDVEPNDPSVMPLENQTAAALPLFNASGALPPDCAAAFPADEQWRCLYGEYRLPYVRTPYVMSASQFDKFQLTYNEGCARASVGAARHCRERARVCPPPFASARASAAGRRRTRAPT